MAWLKQEEAVQRHKLWCRPWNVSNQILDIRRRYPSFTMPGGQPSASYTGPA